MDILNTISNFSSLYCYVIVSDFDAYVDDVNSCALFVGRLLHVVRSGVVM